MVAEPILRDKITELFLNWLASKEVSSLINQDYQQIVNGYSNFNQLNLNSPRLFDNVTVYKNQPPISPRTQLSSSPLSSPRSRYHKNSIQVSNCRSLPILIQNSGKAERDQSTTNAETIPSSTASTAKVPLESKDRVAEADFLRQKKEMLDQKREFEKSKVAEVDQSSLSTANYPQQDKKKQLDEVPFKSDNSTLPNRDSKIEGGIVVQNKKDASAILETSSKNLNDLSTTADKNSATQKLPVDLIVDQSSSSNKSLISSKSIKPFYFPHGVPNQQFFQEDENFNKNIEEEFSKAENGKIFAKNIAKLTKICKLPLYWKNPFFNFLAESKDHITLDNFLTRWKRLKINCKNKISLFIYICTMACQTYLEYDDFLPIVQDVVDNHPGLSFLQDAPEFHSRYIQTVISRIFYCVNRSWSGKITYKEIQNSNLLKTIDLLEEEDDINQITDFFSYEHFYVIYCKFWELDQDHDLLISEADLARHCNHAISSRMIHRIFSGAVTRNMINGKLSYKDFVWFLISEEDKRHPTSIEYWFRCMDIDGDGVISMYEMEYFYEEQIKKMEMLDIETLPFVDCLCQMLDMINPMERGHIRLRDLKTCALTPIFFDTFFNLEKYLRHEQKDPFSSVKDSDEAGMSDWERFASEEYELLVSEEGVDQQADNMYEDEQEINPEPEKNSIKTANEF